MEPRNSEAAKAMVGRTCSRCRERICDKYQRWCAECRAESQRAKEVAKRLPERAWTRVKLTGKRVRELDALAAGPEIDYGDVLQDLDHRERTALMLEVFDTIRVPGKSYTLEEIGQAIGVSRERVRQIEAGGLKKIRRRLSAEQAEDLMLMFEGMSATGRTKAMRARGGVPETVIL